MASSTGQRFLLRTGSGRSWPRTILSPRTALEKQLAELWCELLDLEEIGIDDSFFDLGGASLEVVRMTGLYHSRHGREIPPSSVSIPHHRPTLPISGKERHGHFFLKDVEHRAEQQRGSHSAKDPSHDAVAVIGMVGRFPARTTSNNCGAIFATPRNQSPSLSPRN